MHKIPSRALRALSRSLSSMSPAVHHNATAGFHNAKAYDAHRPSYPAHVVSSFLTDLGVADRKGARVLEVAAGTGKFTEVLAARQEAFEVVSTEPLESMRRELERKGLAVDVKEGSATSLPVEDGWADVCIAAQVGSVCLILSPGSTC